MTCAEFEAVLPDLLEGGGTGEQRAHLTVCAGCSELVSEIDFISQQARMLRASDEPSPRVWNSIEIALRQEGLIREPGMAAGPGTPRPFRQWMLAWLLPTTAAFLLTFGLLRLQHPASPTQSATSSSGQQATDSATMAAVSHARTVPSGEQSAVGNIGNDDQQLLDVVGDSTRNAGIIRDGVARCE